MCAGSLEKADNEDEKENSRIADVVFISSPGRQPAGSNLFLTLFYQCTIGKIEKDLGVLKGRLFLLHLLSYFAKA